MKKEDAVLRLIVITVVVFFLGVYIANITIYRDISITKIITDMLGETFVSIRICEGNVKKTQTVQSKMVVRNLIK